MTIILLVVSVFFGYLAFKGRNILASLAAGGSFYALWYYVQQTYATSMDATLRQLVYVIVVAAIAYLLFRCVHDETGWHFSLNREEKNHVYSHNADVGKRTYNPNSSDSNERQMAYRMELKERLNKHRR
jgi:hypothetical protein